MMRCACVAQDRSTSSIRTKMGRLEKGSPSYAWHFVDSM
jgi:hypothetical protein